MAGWQPLYETRPRSAKPGRRDGSQPGQRGALAAQHHQVVGPGFVSHALIMPPTARFARPARMTATRIAARQGLDTGRGSVVAEEVLHLGRRVLRAVAGVEDQAGNRDVLA